MADSKARQKIDASLPQKQTFALRSISVLKQNFEKVRAEINEAFQSWGDPIQETVDIIVKRRTDKLKLLDDDERGQMLKDIDALLESAEELANCHS
jgi:hypothetical protein